MQPCIRCLIALKIYRHTREGNTYFKKYHGVSYNNMHTIWRYIDVHIVLNANSGQWNDSLWYIWSTIYNVSLRKVFIVWCFFWKQTSLGGVLWAIDLLVVWKVPFLFFYPCNTLGHVTFVVLRGLACVY